MLDLGGEGWAGRPVRVIACSGSWGPLLVSPLRGHVAVGHGLYVDRASGQFRDEALPLSLSEHPTNPFPRSILPSRRSCRNDERAGQLLSRAAAASRHLLNH